MHVLGKDALTCTGVWAGLGLDARTRAVTLVGAGGKTTLLFALAHEAAAQGKRVVVTTTTHIQPHPRLSVARDLGELTRLLARQSVVIYGAPGPEGKLARPNGLEDCLAFADVVLVEGDGAKGLPLKAPATHEPVIPAWTDCVAAVAGLRALGRPIGETCHRSERVCALLDKPPHALVTAADVETLLTHPLGGRKGVPPSARFVCVVNQADTPEQIALGLEIAGHVPYPTMVTAYEEGERGGLCWF